MASKDDTVQPTPEAPSKGSELEELIGAYFTSKRAIHEFFGYKEGWVDIPISDETEHYWMLVGGDPVSGEGATCVWSPEPMTIDTLRAGNSIYSGPVYTQRFLQKWVYRTPSHTMVSVDTECDGNKFLMIFDAKKECTDEEIKKGYSNDDGM